MFDLDDATRILKWCILTFAITIFGLGYVMSGGVEGDANLRVETVCEKASTGSKVTITRGTNTREFTC